MSADLLRRAAALMRERAEAATDGPWMVDPDEAAVVLRPDTPNGWDGYGVAVTLSDESGRYVNTPHIASWHPAVALAVADWLNLAASDVWAWGPPCPCGTGCDVCDDNEWEPHYRRALAVALAYLGADA